MAAKDKSFKNYIEDNRLQQVFLTILLLCSLFFFFAFQVVSAAEPVFYFSAGKTGTDTDGAAYREMEIMQGNSPAEASSIQMEEVWCRYYIPLDNINRTEKPDKLRFMPAVVRIVPSETKGQWTVRIASPVRAACTVVAGFRHDGKRYILQTQFYLYGHGRNAESWKDELRKNQADTCPLPLPYLYFDERPFFLTGQTVTGQYKNISLEALTDKKNLPVQVFQETRESSPPLLTDERGRISFTIPLPAALHNSVWRKEHNRILAVTIPQGGQAMQLFTQIEVRDNYFAYDNVPHGIAVMVLSAVLTAAAILFWHRRSCYHGY